MKIMRIMKSFSVNQFKNKALNTSVMLALSFTVFCSSAIAADHKQTLKLVDDAVKPIAETILNPKIHKSTWHPSYHLASFGHSMKHPNAITGFNGDYHLFYQHEVNTSEGKKTVWGHVSSPDFINWTKLPSPIAPSESYDKDGVYSGSAIVDEGLLYLVYTGYSETKQGEKTIKHETQNLAMSKDGINFGKSANNPVIKMAPHYSYLEFSSEKFRDPYVWKLEDRFYALVGTQYEKTKDGAVLLFKSKDLRNWVCINVTALGQKGEMGDMWEIPSLVHIKGQDVLSVSTQGIKPQGKMYLNKYQSGAFVGKLDYDTGRFSQKGAFMLYDYGFDFYAPQFVTTNDNRHVFIAQLGMDGTELPEQTEKWSGMMTLPRELKIVDGKILTFPIKEVETLRTGKITITPQTLKSEKEFANVKGETYEIDMCADLTDAKNFTIKLRTSPIQETVLSYDTDTKILKLNRDKAGKALKGEREVLLPLSDNKLKLRIFVDKSSVEIFANDGKAAMSSKIYPDKNSLGIKFSSIGETKIEKLDFYRLKSVYN